MVVWEVLGRPLMPVRGGIALMGVPTDEEDEDEEMGLECMLSLLGREVFMGGVVGGGVDAAEELEEMGDRGWFVRDC
jgi:hypothetical protein